MAYSNTSEFYCGVSAIDNAEHSTNQKYFNQIPPNYEIPPYIYTPENYIQQENYNHEEYNIKRVNCTNQDNCLNQETYIKQENYINQAGYPTLIPAFSSYDPAQREQITHGCTHFYENYYSVPQYNSMQYTPRMREPVSYPVFHQQPIQPYQRKHRAQITILRTSRGNLKAVVKHKRKRTIFTTEQVQALEDIFKTKQYINREERQDIVKKLQLGDKAVKIWFQNRRLKNKRMPEESSEESEDCPDIRHSVEEMSSPDIITSLDLVESQITKKTDEFGYVTLDEGVMGGLVNVIDDFLKNNLDVSSKKYTESDSSPIYEPISPASLTDSNEEDNSSCWRPCEPNKSLQRLFDLQTML